MTLGILLLRKISYRLKGSVVVELSLPHILKAHWRFEESPKTRFTTTNNLKA